MVDFLEAYISEQKEVQVKRSKGQRDLSLEEGESVNMRNNWELRVFLLNLASSKPASLVVRESFTVNVKEDSKKEHNSLEIMHKYWCLLEF